MSILKQFISKESETEVTEDREVEVIVDDVTTEVDEVKDTEVIEEPVMSPEEAEELEKEVEGISREIEDGMYEEQRLDYLREAVEEAEEVAVITAKENDGKLSPELGALVEANRRIAARALDENPDSGEGEKLVDVPSIEALIEGKNVSLEAEGKVSGLLQRLKELLSKFIEWLKEHGKKFIQWIRKILNVLPSELKYLRNDLKALSKEEYERGVAALNGKTSPIVDNRGFVIDVQKDADLFLNLHTEFSKFFFTSSERLVNYVDKMRNGYLGDTFGNEEGVNKVVPAIVDFYKKKIGGKKFNVLDETFTATVDENRCAVKLVGERENNKLIVPIKTIDRSSLMMALDIDSNLFGFAEELHNKFSNDTYLIKLKSLIDKTATDSQWLGTVYDDVNKVNRINFTTEVAIGNFIGRVYKHIKEAIKIGKTIIANAKGSDMAENNVVNA